MFTSIPPVQVDLSQDNEFRDFLALPAAMINSPVDCLILNGVSIQHLISPPQETPEHSFQQTFLAINLGQVQKMERWYDGIHNRYSLMTGEFNLVPAHFQQRVRWEKTLEFVVIGIDDQRIRQSIEQLELRQSVEVLPRFKGNDPLIYQMGLILKSELASGAVNRAYIDAMVQSTILHLLHQYITAPAQLRSLSMTLSQTKLNDVLEYIHLHLNQEVHIDTLAQIAHASPYYFVRAFKQAMGITPHAYIVQQRLEHAKQLLRTTALSLTEIAYTTGFSCQSHFSKAFRQHIQTSPSIYRQQQ